MNATDSRSSSLGSINQRVLVVLVVVRLSVCSAILFFGPLSMRGWTLHGGPHSVIESNRSTRMPISTFNREREKRASESIRDIGRI